MKKLLSIIALTGSIVCAQDFSQVISSNQVLLKVNKQMDEKIITLKKDIAEYKKNLLKEVKREMEKEQDDYETLLKSLNLFKLKHGKNIYAQKQIKINEEKLKEVRVKHVDFKSKYTVHVEQLQHEEFIPIQKKDMQEKIFYFEIKREEFRELFKVNKKRYESTIDLAVERFKNDSDALIEEFNNLEYKKIK